MYIREFVIHFKYLRSGSSLFRSLFLWNCILSEFFYRLLDINLPLILTQIEIVFFQVEGGLKLSKIFVKTEKKKNQISNFYYPLKRFLTVTIYFLLTKENIFVTVFCFFSYTTFND